MKLSARFHFKQIVRELPKILQYLSVTTTCNHVKAINVLGTMAGSYKKMCDTSAFVAELIRHTNLLTTLTRKPRDP